MSPERRRAAMLLRARWALANAGPAVPSESDAAATAAEPGQPWPRPTVMTLPLPEFWEIPGDARDREGYEPGDR